MNLLHSIILLFSLNMFSQTKTLKLTYDIQLKFTKEVFFKGCLVGDNDNAVFKYDNKSTAQNKTAGIVLSDSKNTYEIVNGIKDKRWVIEEVFPVINWNILNEFKFIDDFEVQKATTYFAGRSYTAWFTTDIPLSFGVFRLHGLPGAILQLRDDSEEIIVDIVKIESGDLTTLEENISSIESIERISRQKYMQFIKDLIIDISNKLKASQPEGFDSDVKIEMVKMVEMPPNN